ncbi:MAG TPA: DUF4260 domain-containing protein, partial [Candidatus Paceibacterota bacterium]
MKQTLQLECLALFVLSLGLFVQLPFSWWWYPVLFLLPDIGMVGYLASPRIGALTYNLTHHYAVAMILMGGGMVLDVPILMLGGVVVLGHSAFDRLLGYGLKYPDSFH